MKKKYWFLLGVIIYITLTIITFYTELIHDETCGIKSKLLFITLSTIVLVVLSIIYFYIHKKSKINPENIFLITALLVGTLYMFATPIFKGHDEQFHWYKSYAVSIGNFLPSTNDDNIIGDYLPRMVNDVFEIQGFFTEINYKTSINAWKYSISNKSNDEIQFTYNAPTANYPPVQMLPQATGILLARTIGLDIYSQAIAGRFFNLLFFIITGYFAIKMLPNKKIFFLIVLLSPKILYLSSTLSGDVFTNGIIILFTSYILKLRNDKRQFTVKNFLILLLLLPGVAISKIIYLPICMLILLIPKECFVSNKRKYLIVGSLLIVSLAVSMFWIVYSNTGDNFNENANNQLTYVLTHPLSFGGVLIRGVSDNFAKWSLDMVGGYMEWGTQLVQPEIISCAIYLLLIISLAQENSEKNIKFNLLELSLIGIIIIIEIIGVLAAMYITWTPIHDEIGGLQIIGVQGRYFIPILMLIISILPTKLLEAKNKLSYTYIYIAILLLQFPTLLNIFVHNI